MKTSTRVVHRCVRNNLCSVWYLRRFSSYLQNICMSLHNICTRFAQHFNFICTRFACKWTEIYLRYTCHISKIYLRYTQYTWNVPGICIRYTWKRYPTCWQIFHLSRLSEWVSEWVTDMPGSRDAYASKNLTKLKTI